MDLEEQYEKIYRYCYFKIHNREIAEDITQETFLRFFKSNYVDNGKAMQYLYTIARNMCIDEYRKQKAETLKEEVIYNYSEDNIIEQISVKKALAELDESDRELLLLRYVNEVPVSVIGKLYHISRFAVYRKISQAKKNLKDKL